jgi:hypothetical protein
MGISGGKGGTEKAAAEPAWWCHVCMRTVPASQVPTHQHDAGADGPR